MDYNSILSWLQNLLSTSQGSQLSNAQALQSGNTAGQLAVQAPQLQTQKDMQAAQLANALQLQSDQTAGQLAVQAPQLQTQKDLQAAQQASTLKMQGNQLGEQGREFNTTTGNAMQQQNWAQNYATVQDAYTQWLNQQKMMTQYVAPYQAQSVKDQHNQRWNQIQFMNGIIVPGQENKLYSLGLSAGV